MEIKCLDPHGISFQSTSTGATSALARHSWAWHQWIGAPSFYRLNGKHSENTWYTSGKHLWSNGMCQMVLCQNASNVLESNMEKGELHLLGSWLGYAEKAPGFEWTDDINVMFGKQLGDFREMSAPSAPISKMVCTIGFDSLTVGSAGSKGFDRNRLRLLRWLPTPKRCCRCRVQCTFTDRAVTIALRFWGEAHRHAQVNHSSRIQNIKGDTVTPKVKLATLFVASSSFNVKSWKKRCGRTYFAWHSVTGSVAFVFHTGLWFC